MAIGLNSQLGDDLETILVRITEVVSWCTPHVDTSRPKTCLRSAALAPHPLDDGRKRVVASVARRRHAALGRPQVLPAGDLAAGRLLIYEPDFNLAHGLEELETMGFVDLENTPPWDTWVAYVYEQKQNYLLSWVPRDFISFSHQWDER
jgi:hypothetical protein